MSRRETRMELDATFSLFPHFTWSGTTPARSRIEKCVTHTGVGDPPLAQAQVWFQKYKQSVLACVRESFEEKDGPLPLEWSSAGRHAATRRTVATICLTLTRTFLWDTLSGLPSNETHRVCKLCCAFMSLFTFFFFGLNIKVDYPVQNNSSSFPSSSG